MRNSQKIGNADRSFRPHSKQNTFADCIFVFSVTKDKDKLQNINDALQVFDNWLKEFEKLNLSKENRAYLPLASIELLLPLKKQYKIEDKQAEKFLEAYKSVKGEYKNLRTVLSGENEPSWDIVRNTVLKKLLKGIDDENPDLWKDDLPTKEHLELILWAYSPDASKIKKSSAKFEEKLGKSEEKKKESEDEKEESPKGEKRSSTKRKSESSSSASDDESPKKKKK